MLCTEINLGERCVVDYILVNVGPRDDVVSFHHELHRETVTVYVQPVQEIS